MIFAEINRVYIYFKIMNGIIVCEAIGMIKFYNLSTGE